MVKEECFEPTGTMARSRRHIKGCLKKQLKDVYNKEELVEDFLKIQGLDDARFDYIASVSNMIYGAIKDNSIDQNANRFEASMTSVMDEADNVSHKLAGYDFLYRQLKQNVGKKEAQRIMSEVYDYSLAINDATKLHLVYCWAMNGSKLVMEGRGGNPVVRPAKHLLSYVSMLTGTMQMLSNSSLAGAVACGTFFIDISRILLMDGYTLEEIKYDKAVRKEITQAYEQMVYALADPVRSTFEPIFSNLSLFDRVKLEGMVDDMDWYFYETGVEKDYIIETIIEIQKIAMDYMDIGDPSTGLPFTFPVMTVNIAKTEDGDILDNEFVQDLCQRPVHRYNIMVSSGSKVASCCFDGSQKALVNTSSGIRFDTFANLFSKGMYNWDGVNAKMFHNGSWVRFKRVVVPYDKKYYKITTSNNKQLIVTEDHLNPTLRGDILSKDLCTDDWILFNTRPLDKLRGYPAEENPLGFNAGYAVGLFLGDGSYIKNYNGEYSGVNYSLNEGCIDECARHINAFLRDFGGETSRFSPQNNTHPLVFKNAEAVDIILRFVKGDRSFNKELNLDALYESIEFRKGILAGWYASDGGSTNRCYSVSKNLIDTMEVLCTSLGFVTSIDVSDRSGDGVILVRGESFNRNYPLYCLRWYDVSTCRNYKDLFKIRNNSAYFKIKSIELVDGSDNAYCVEVTGVNADEPYFTLPNGVITHNCRMTSDDDMLAFAGNVNSFGGGGASNLGSHRVVVLNLNRAAILATSKEDFYNRMDNLIKDATMLLRAHKDMIIALEKIGLQPAITKGLIDINRLFSTYGIIGTYETCQTIQNKFGEDPEFDVEMIKHLNEVTLKCGKEAGLIINQEQIPGESMAVRLATADRLLFGAEAVPFKLYSNQAVPLTEDVDIFDRMDRWGRLDKYLTGGGIVHLTINERVSPEQALAMIKYSVKSGAEHFAFNLIHSVCDNDHVIEGKFDECPKCGAEVNDWALRIVGFLRKVSSWSKERQEEFHQRKINKF